MTKFIINQEFWELFPMAEIAVVLAKGIDNTETHLTDTMQEINNLLLNSSKEATKFLTEEVFSENRVISV